MTNFENSDLQIFTTNTRTDMSTNNPSFLDPENDFITDVSGNADTPIHFGENFTVSTTNENSNERQFSDADSLKIGEKYFRKLNVTDGQVEILNTLWFAGNVFNEIEYCKIQILKQFVRAVDYLYTSCIPVNKSYATVVDELSEIIVCIKYNYRKESLNYRYTYQSVQAEIFNHILKLCENNVRESYGIKRKINTDFNYNHPDILHQYNRKMVSKLEIFLTENRHKILDADARTNIILNENNTNRWKDKFDVLKEDYSNAIAFEREIFRLADVNIKNPSVESIFFEASKFMADHDKKCALRFYIHYLEKDLQSQKFDHKQLAKNIHKSLFSTQEQVHDFERILSDFIGDRNLETAIEKANKLYETKRKKIVIDAEAIENVKRQHSGTVALLEEYLKDDDEDESISVKNQDATDKNELTINITHENTESQHSKYVDDLNLTDIQKEILDLFEKQSFTVLQSEFEIVIKSKNLFMGSTIDSINESCFEILDDILIEEEDDYFTINTDYYKKLLNND